jgi:hypothetical protein
MKKKKKKLLKKKNIAETIIVSKTIKKINKFSFIFVFIKIKFCVYYIIYNNIFQKNIDSIVIYEIKINTKTQEKIIK